MQARLLVVGGQEQTRHFDLHLPAIVGRSRTTDVTLFHPLVSRQHCELFEHGGQLMVRDLGSLNGTFVGETRLDAEAVPLAPGSRLTIGCITLLAEYQPAEEPAASDDWPSGGPTRESPISEALGEELRFDPRHRPRPSVPVERRPRD